MCALTWPYILPVYDKVIVPVRSVLLVVKPDGVGQLVDDSPERFAAESKRDRLDFACISPVGITPEK